MHAINIRSLLRPAAALLALALAGCNTTAMKGTPFFTGESTRRTGTAEDRVNLWPMLYYREPDLSVLWPLGEYTGDSLSLRPFFSIENLDQKQRVYNLLWPIGRFDTARNVHRFFPFFWGTDHRVVFPLYWHYDTPFALNGKGSDSLWPLWCYFRDYQQYSLHLLWPIFNTKSYDDDQGWRLWPLYGSYENPKTDSGYRYALWPLAWHTWSPSARTWTLFPLFHDARDDDSHTFGTLLGGWQRDRATDTTDWYALPILGWGSSTPDSSQAAALLGLYGHHFGPAGSGSRLIPLYYHRQTPAESLFLSPLYIAWDVDPGRMRAIPLLLSAWYADEDSREVIGALGLFRARWGEKDTTNKGHLFPLYYYDHQTLLTPLFGRWHDNGTTLRYWLTPLLGTRSGHTHGSWLAPLYSYSADPVLDTTHGWFLGFGEFRRSPRKSYTHFPILFEWDYDTSRSATGNWTRASGSLLLCLYDYRREQGRTPPDAAPHDYTRHRVLFRLYHHERLNGATSIDLFPGMTYDRDPAAGKRSFTLLWRLLRYARAPDKRAVDLLFIPVWRSRTAPPAGASPIH